jgi:hypothetical protein
MENARTSPEDLRKNNPPLLPGAGWDGDTSVFSAILFSFQILVCNPEMSRAKLVFNLNAFQLGGL